MKRIFAFICLVAAGCTQFQMPERETAVSFGLSIYESGRFPTKGFASEIASHYPDVVELTLTNDDTNTPYTVLTGDQATIPVGTYTVTGGYLPESIQKNYGSTKFLSYEPGISVEDNIAVVAGTENYTVNASYTSFAIGINPATISSWKVKVKDGTMQDVDYIDADDLRWIFATGYFSNSTPLVMTITPVSGSAITYTLTLDEPQDDQTKVEYGKWYMLGAGALVTQAGTFSLDTTWEEGQL